MQTDVQIVELPRSDRTQEENQEDQSDSDRNRNEEGDRDHPFSRRATADSTRAAPARTIPLDSGMSTAATSGFTYPTEAAATASTL